MVVKKNRKKRKQQPTPTPLPPAKKPATTQCPSNGPHVATNLLLTSPDSKPQVDDAFHLAGKSMLLAMDVSASTVRPAVSQWDEWPSLTPAEANNCLAGGSGLHPIFRFSLEYLIEKVEYRSARLKALSEAFLQSHDHRSSASYGNSAWVLIFPRGVEKDCNVYPDIIDGPHQYFTEPYGRAGIELKSDFFDAALDFISIPFRDNYDAVQRGITESSSMWIVCPWVLPGGARRNKSTANPVCFRILSGVIWHSVRGVGSYIDFLHSFSCPSKWGLTPLSFEGLVHDDKVLGEGLGHCRLASLMIGTIQCLMVAAVGGNPLRVNDRTTQLIFLQCNVKDFAFFCFIERGFEYHRENDSTPQPHNYPRCKAPKYSSLPRAFAELASRKEIFYQHGPKKEDVRLLVLCSPIAKTDPPVPVPSTDQADFLYSFPLPPPTDKKNCIRTNGLLQVVRDRIAQQGGTGKLLVDCPPWSNDNWSEPDEDEDDDSDPLERKFLMWAHQHDLEATMPIAFPVVEFVDTGIGNLYNKNAKEAANMCFQAAFLEAFYGTRHKYTAHELRCIMAAMDSRYAHLEDNHPAKERVWSRLVPDTEAFPEVGILDLDVRAKSPPCEMNKYLKDFVGFFFIRNNIHRRVQHRQPAICPTIRQCMACERLLFFWKGGQSPGRHGNHAGIQSFTFI